MEGQKWSKFNKFNKDYLSGGLLGPEEKESWTSFPREEAADPKKKKKCPIKGLSYSHALLFQINISGYPLWYSTE